MRFILILIIGLLASFYLSAAIKQVVHKKVHSLIGFLLIVLAFILGFFGVFLTYPLNVLLSFFLAGTGIGIIAHHLLSESYIVSERLEKGFISRHDSMFERFLEILPGALTWVALTSPIWLSFTLPFAVAYLIIVADIYWLVNAFKISALTFIGYRRMEKAKKEDWLERLKKDFPKSVDYYHLIILPTYKEGLEILSASFDAIANSNYPK